MSAANPVGCSPAAGETHDIHLDSRVPKGILALPVRDIAQIGRKEANLDVEVNRSSMTAKPRLLWDAMGHWPGSNRACALRFRRNFGKATLLFPPGSRRSRRIVMTPRGGHLPDEPPPAIPLFLAALAMQDCHV